MNRRPSQSRSGFDSFSPQHTAHFKAAQPGDDFFEPRPRAPLGRRVLVFLLLLLLAALAANLAINQFVQVARVTVPIRKMDSALEGYTLLHISDLKGASYGANQSRIRFALQKEDFDAVVLTGDMVSSRGNAQPLYTLIEMLHELKPGVPIYMIPGDKDPLPTSMSYAASGSPFAPWVLGARRRGAQMLSAPVRIERDGHALWLTTSALLSLDMDTMQEQFERHGMDGNGSDWDRLAKAFLKTKTDLRGKIRFDSQQDLFCVYSRDAAAVKTFIYGFRAACETESEREELFGRLTEE